MCGTCGRNKTECPGHWGVIVLELPVFHLGFLKATINVLQNICKMCSRVLLKPEERKTLLRAMRDPRTDSLKRTRLRRKITETTKKCATCPHWPKRLGSPDMLKWLYASPPASAHACTSAAVTPRMGAKRCARDALAG
jgi:DNA-directed RNA polymerase beta' subunit